jgi:hypothetical protein
LIKAITQVSVATETNVQIKTATDAGSTQVSYCRDDEDVQFGRQ